MEHIVHAVVPDASTCELLAIPSTEPCLCLERRTWHQGRVVTYAQLTYPSSRYDLGARYTLERGAAVGTIHRRSRADAADRFPGRSPNERTPS